MREGTGKVAELYYIIIFIYENRIIISKNSSKERIIVSMGSKAITV